MTQVHGNPKEMRRFSKALHQFASQLETEVRRIDGHSREVGQYWNDNEYRKFIQEWEQTFIVLKRFLRDAPKYENHVNKKAADLEAYLGSRS